MCIMCMYLHMICTHIHTHTHIYIYKYSKINNYHLSFIIDCHIMSLLFNSHIHKTLNQSQSFTGLSVLIQLPPKYDVVRCHRTPTKSSVRLHGPPPEIASELLVRALPRKSHSCPRSTPQRPEEQRVKGQGVMKYDESLKNKVM